ncbi:recombination protein RecR [Candidatus Uhrbacteria bacterium]|nr:recombination protein RecR [Candidatus Uhrbacteria bacterium]
MRPYPPAIQSLIEIFRRFPGVGPKSAERFVFHLLRGSGAEIDALVTRLQELRMRIDRCAVCGTFAERSPCATCTDPRRDRGIVCVVAEPGDLAAVERTGEFRGCYHILGGLLAPIEGIGPEQLRIGELIERVRTPQPAVQEIILALDPTIEGETTVNYLAAALAGSAVRVTRLARGLPVGGDLEYADPVTLSDALSGRRELPPARISVPTALMPKAQASRTGEAPPF